MQSGLHDISGQVIKGYELRQLIGRGGFGAVYRAYQPLVGREVAIKIILPEYANLPNFIRRFDIEAQLVAQLEHIHIVPLYDYWREPTGACLVMRLLRGGSLQDALESQGRWEIPAVARLIDQIAAALAAAHRQGVIHRDLKPPNILLDEENNAYLADFGIAKNLVTGQETVADDERFGSPAYISPEQVIGQGVTHQSDIYSLGVVLFMMLTGQTPFLDPSTTTVIRRHVQEPLPPLQMLRADLPPALNMVIWRATAKQPADRYPDALSLAADFRRVLSLEMGNEFTGAAVSAAPQRRAVPAEAGRTMMIDVPADPKNPYKGLQAFQESDAANFFGRGDLAARLTSRLETSRFLAVIGPSGSGKSSVVKAGIIPLLRRGALHGSQDWFITQMTPGAQPFVELEAALLAIAMSASDNIAERLLADASSLPAVLKQIMPANGAEVLLVIDQFEEIFTLVGDERERAQFIATLAAAVQQPDSSLRVIITLRADMYDRPLLYPELGDLIRTNNEVVLPLNAAEMREAIVGPVHWLGMQFEPGLVEVIIQDVTNQVGALPLLQYALTELFERREGHVLTRAAYEASGGVLGSLARRADEVYEQLQPAGRAAGRQLFLRLVNPGDGTDDTRRRVMRYELERLAGDRRVMGEVIEAFSRYRLLTLDREPVTRAPTVEVAHEALIRVWTKLRIWLDASREDLRLQRRLAAVTAEWINAGRDSSYLASGARLAQFEALANTSLLGLNEDELSYISASTAARQRRANIRRAAIAVLVIITVVAVGLAALALDRQNAAISEQMRADNQARISRSRELAVTALNGVSEVDLGLLLSVEALRTADTFEAQNSLVSRLASISSLRRFMHGHTAGVRAAAYSADNRWIVSGAANGEIIVWDAERGQIVHALAGHESAVNCVAFSPDSRFALSGGSDGLVRLWDVEAGTVVADAVSNPVGAIWAAAFNPEGTLAAFASERGLIYLWDVARRELVGEPFSADPELIHSLAFSPDGRLLASAGQDNAIVLWDVSRREQIGEPLAAHRNWVLSVAFSPDSGMLASAGADNQIILWDVARQAQLARISDGHRDWIRSIAFSPDGLLLASGSSDRTVRLWSMETGEAVGQPFVAHTDSVWGVAFSPDGKTLVSASQDRTLIQWDVMNRQLLGRTLRGHSDGILDVNFSPDGKFLASSSGSLGNRRSQDNTVRVWDVTTGEALRVLEGHQDSVSAVAYSPDGRIIASASADKTVRLWDADTGGLIRQLDLEVSSPYVQLAFSPDGKLLAVGNDSGSIRLWDVEQGSAVGRPLQRHSEGILDLAFTPDGKLLASASKDDTVILWDVASGVPSGEPLTGHLDDASSVAFDAKGEILASGSYDRTIILWDVRSRRPVGQPLAGHTDWILDLDFSADSSRLISVGADQRVILWDVPSRRQLGQPFLSHLDWVVSAAFSPVGLIAATGSQDKTVILWDFSRDSLVDRACAAANRSLSDLEWAQYFEGEAYHRTC